MKQLRPYGRDRVAIHLEAGHPALDDLKKQALFVTTYSQAGAPVAFDLFFPADQAAQLRRELAENGQI